MLRHLIFEKKKSCKLTSGDGVLLGIPGEGVTPGSPNPDPHFRPKNAIFSTLVSRPGL